MKTKQQSPEYIVNTVDINQYNTNEVFITLSSNNEDSGYALKSGNAGANFSIVNLNNGKANYATYTSSNNAMFSAKSTLSTPTGNLDFQLSTDEGTTFNLSGSFINDQQGFTPDAVAQITMNSGSSIAYMLGHTMSAANTPTQSGIFKSSNFGFSWQLIAVSEPDSIIDNIALDPNDDNKIQRGGYKGNGIQEESYLYESVDGGETWQAIVSLDVEISSFQENILPGKTWIDPANSSFIFYAGINQDNPTEIFWFSSQDSGSSWAYLLPNLNYDVFNLELSKQNAKNIFGGNTNMNQLYYSFTSGIGFSGVLETGANMPSTAFCIDPQNDAICYSGGLLNEVNVLYKTINNGANWSTTELITP